MPIDLTKLVDLGGTVIVAVIAIWVLRENQKMKRNPLNGSQKEIIKELQSLNTNHLSDICRKIDEGNNRLVEAINDGNSKTIEVLGDIKGVLGEIKGSLK